MPLLNWFEFFWQSISTFHFENAYSKSVSVRDHLGATLLLYRRAIWQLIMSSISNYIYCIFPRILVYYFHQSLMQETHTMTCHFLNFDKVTSGLLANHLTYERMLTNKSELLYRGSPFLPDSHSPCGPVDHYRWGLGRACRSKVTSEEEPACLQFNEENRL